jgi:hypothetical protein
VKSTPVGSEGGAHPDPASALKSAVSAAAESNTVMARRRNKPPFRLTPVSVSPPSRAVRGAADLPTPPAATDERRPNPAQPRSSRARSARRHTSPMTPSAPRALVRSATRPTSRRRRVAAPGPASTDGPAVEPEQERRSTRRGRGGSGGPTPPRRTQ